MANRKVKRTSFKVDRLQFTKTYIKKSSYSIEPSQICDSFMTHTVLIGFFFSLEHSLSYLGKNIRQVPFWAILKMEVLLFNLDQPSNFPMTRHLCSFSSH